MITLEDSMMEIFQQENLISIKPTRLYIPRYPDDTDDSYQDRIKSAQKLVNELEIKK